MFVLKYYVNSIKILNKKLQNTKRIISKDTCFRYNLKIVLYGQSKYSKFILWSKIFSNFATYTYIFLTVNSST